jgi:hypothetical protein
MVERPYKASQNSNDKKVIEDDLSAKDTRFEKWNLYGSYNPKYVYMLIKMVRILF